MTIAIALKVADGIVLGADSASTLTDENGQVVNVYFNAEKVFNLYKGLPIGFVTYGLGSLDGRSITGLAKDLRERLSTKGTPESLDPATYTIGQVANIVKAFFYDDFYKKEWPKKRSNGAVTVDVFANMGILIGGYSAGSRKGEIWSIEIDDKGVCSVTAQLDGDAVGIRAGAQIEPIHRILNGYSPRILAGMIASGVAEADAKKFLNQSMEPLIHGGMPIQDAIDLCLYLVEVTAGFVRFIPGAPTVHPPLDIAAISVHEGFRWVRRKHYYSAELNQPIIKV